MTSKAFCTAVLTVVLIAASGPAAPSASAQGRSYPSLEGRKRITAERLREGEQIVLDGRLDEPPWQRAVPARDFIQQQPILGGSPTEPTEVRIVFDRDNLYMGVICFDSEPQRLLGNTMKRDEFLAADDRFMWTLDTFLDQRSGYFFEMNPAGLMADALMGPGGVGGSREWDGIWDARVRVSEIGWTIEIKIPFRTLNFDPNAPAWGINFQRTIRRKNEENLWTGHLFNQGLRRMANAGLLVGIHDVSQGRGLDLKPYAAAAFAAAPGRQPVVAGRGEGAVGLDVSYNLTPSLRAYGSLNTDFAETEVDARLVNLTRFPLFFPEKRTFFLDGATFFDFYLARSMRDRASPVQPFFSRRIGLVGGVPQRIDVGAKLTGQADAYDLGALYVRTGAESARPGEDFTVLRLKRRVLAQSSFGGIYTNRRARTAGLAPRHTAGLDLRLATSRFRGSDNLELDAFVLWNTDVTGTGDALAYGARLAYPNDRWDGRLAFHEVGRNHDPAVGFTPRRGFRQFNPALRFAPRPRQHPWIRQLAVGGEFDLFLDTQGRPITRALDLTVLRVETHRQDSVEFTVQPQLERLEEEFEIHPGVRLPVGSAYSFTRHRVAVNTASRRVLSTRSSVEWGRFLSGDRQELSVQLGLRPRRGVTINAEGEWNRVRLAEGQFTTRVLRVVTDTQFNPWMYIVNNVQYDSVSRVLGWQMRYRWILKPGSDLYVVYHHNWIDLPGAGRLRTLDRRAASKVVYTHRF